jgi:hypothetical protein
MTNRAFFDQHETGNPKGLTPEMQELLDQPAMQNQLAIAISLIEARLADHYLVYLEIPEGEAYNSIRELYFHEFNALCLALRTITGSKHEGFNFGNKEWVEKYQSDK